MKKKTKDQDFIKQPVLPGGRKAFNAHLRKHLKYPQKAIINRIEGSVFIKYDIDYKGNVVDTKVISGIGYGCDEEAERVVRLLKFQVPKTRKIRVLFHKDIKVNFRLPLRQTPTISYEYQVSPTKSKESKDSGDSTSSIGYTITWKS